MRQAFEAEEARWKCRGERRLAELDAAKRREAAAKAEAAAASAARRERRHKSQQVPLRLNPKLQIPAPLK